MLKRRKQHDTKNCKKGAGSFCALAVMMSFDVYCNAAEKAMEQKPQESGIYSYMYPPTEAVVATDSFVIDLPTGNEATGRYWINHHSYNHETGIVTLPGVMVDMGATTTSDMGADIILVDQWGEETHLHQAAYQNTAFHGAGVSTELNTIWTEQKQWKIWASDDEGNGVIHYAREWAK